MSVELYKTVKGKKREHAYALLEDTQKGVAGFAAAKAVLALSNRMRHVAEGHADIELESGNGTNPDWYVVLSDDRGLGAAMSIEFGRDAIRDDDGNIIWNATEPTWILHNTFGLTKKRKPTKPRMKRHKGGGGER